MHMHAVWKLAECLRPLSLPSPLQTLPLDCGTLLRDGKRMTSDGNGLFTLRCQGTKSTVDTIVEVFKFQYLQHLSGVVSNILIFALPWTLA